MSVYNCGYNVSCNGASDGSIDLSASGGADCLAYSYAWSNGATTEDVSGLTAGTYSVTVTDANGCFSVSTFTLTEPDEQLITGVTAKVYACGYNISCNGESDGEVTTSWTGGADCLGATVTLTGPMTATGTGSSPVTITGLIAGTYTVTVVDANGCTTTSSITLTEPDPLTVDAGPNATVFPAWAPLACTDLLGSASAGGCAPYTYEWSTSAGPFATGIGVTVCPTVTTVYYLTITDANGCTFTDSLQVCSIDIVCGSAGPHLKIQICHKPAGGPGPWDTKCLPMPAIAAHLAHGDYIGPCTGGTSVAPCEWPAGPAKAGSEAQAGGDIGQNSGMSLEAFPNPFADMTTIRFQLKQSDDVTVKVYSLTGEEVSVLFDGRVEANEWKEIEFRPNSLTSGIYLAKVVTGSGEVRHVKLVFTK
jgi:hypothetical protein